MAQLTLSQLLDLAIGTPEVGAVNFPTLHSLLLAILRHLGLLDLPAREVLGEQQLAEAQPGEEGGQGRGTGCRTLAPEDSLRETTSSPQVADVAADMDQMKKRIEANESNISKDMSVSRDLLEEIDGIKAAQSHMEEDIRTIQEALGLGKLQDGTGQLLSLRDQTSLDDDVKNLKERLSLYPAPEEGSSGTQSASSESSTSDVDTLYGASSDPELKGAGTQPAARTSRSTSKGIPGTQPGSLSKQAGVQKAPMTPEKRPSAPSDHTRTSDASVTTPGTQPGPPGTKTTTPGMQPGHSSTQSTTPEMQMGHSSTQSTTPGMQPEYSSIHSTTPGMQPGYSSTQSTTPGMQPGYSISQTTTPGMQPAPPGTQEGGAEVQPTPLYMEPSLPSAENVPAEATPGALGTQMDATSLKAGGKVLSSTQLAQTGHLSVGTLLPTAQGREHLLAADHKAMSPSQEPNVLWGSSGSVSAPERYVETVEALRQVGQLGHLYSALKEQVAQLEATKLEATEVERLRLLLPEGEQESIASILADLQGQVSSLQRLVSDLRDEKGKSRQLEDALGRLGAAGVGLKADTSDQITLEPESALQEVKQELKELGEHQEMTKATLEQLVTKSSEQLQEQLDKLREMVESSPGQEQAECPTCSTDTSWQLGQLLQRYEKLQELMHSFMSQQPVGKMMKPMPRRTQQDEELLKHIQATVVHLQGDYEKLSSVTGNLLDDCHQKQKDIEALFQSLERLEKEKVDKEDLLLGIDVKADKSALAGKVNRTQFDASMERLNEVIQEMLSRVTGQEQGWHQLQQQLSEELGSKLDRLELGPFRQQLEEHWRSTLEKIKEKEPGTKADDAAGIKKQLLSHFHCVSCDRPLNMLVPGPLVPTVPSMPSLPSRLAGDLQTILEQEHAQQHSHRERAAEGRFPSVPRHCGGQHTLTLPLQRCQRPRSLPPGTPQPLHTPLPGKAPRGTRLSCPHGSGTPRTPFSCTYGPRVLGPRSARQAPPPRWSTSQPLPAARALPPAPAPAGWIQHPSSWTALGGPD
ncbi:glutamine-rich protein 2 isoform X3 [Pogoniulus pusillus]|uniref:glutamine-rich protein 2 isoform X3 n=1 Tax=Pogoniulus pusillus TaxID=488313 RepID=UPI0030B981B0